MLINRHEIFVNRECFNNINFQQFKLKLNNYVNSNDSFVKNYSQRSRRKILSVKSNWIFRIAINNSL